MARKLEISPNLDGNSAALLAQASALMDTYITTYAGNPDDLLVQAEAHIREAEGYGANTTTHRIRLAKYDELRAQDPSPCLLEAHGF